jgi:hypothetical protein
MRDHDIICNNIDTQCDKEAEMKLFQLVSSVFVGLLAGLLGLVVVTAIRAGVAISHLGQDVTQPAGTTKRSSNSYARPGTDAAVIVKIPEGTRRRDRGLDESRPAA